MSSPGSHPAPHTGPHHVSGRRPPHPLRCRRPAPAGEGPNDAGMSTAEYAIGTVAAAAFAALLYAVVTDDSVLEALTSVVRRALSVDF
ncbi:DUF4244 domain-containing protein [Saccharomonospora iraqiensis]|uniref:DUF4244 domain-containing protein n=1 Tax=Saccharomonospora iraqiensis TaxID=52698 RepID=UPI00022DFD19